MWLCTPLRKYERFLLWLAFITSLLVTPTGMPIWILANNGRFKTIQVSQEIEIKGSNQADWIIAMDERLVGEIKVLARRLWSFIAIRREAIILWIGIIAMIIAGLFPPLRVLREDSITFAFCSIRPDVALELI